MTYAPAAVPGGVFEGNPAPRTVQGTLKEKLPTLLRHTRRRCNRRKGPNVGSFDPLTGILVPLFNPRTHTRTSHFEWDGATIQPLTPEARATVRILRLNDADRVAERQRLMEVGSYI